MFIHIHLYVCTNTYMYVHIYILYMHIHLHVYICIQICIHMHIYLYTCIYTLAQILIHRNTLQHTATHCNILQQCGDKDGSTWRNSELQLEAKNTTSALVFMASIKSNGHVCSRRYSSVYINVHFLHIYLCRHAHAHTYVNAYVHAHAHAHVSAHAHAHAHAHNTGEHSKNMGKILRNSISLLKMYVTYCMKLDV